MSSTSSLSTSTSELTTTVSTTAEPTITEDHACKVVLYFEVPYTKIRLWDVIILIPNFLFLLFLIIRFNKALLKLRATNSPIFLTFYCLVILNVTIGMLRCFVSMVVNSSSLVGSYADIILWVITRFFLLMTEMSVVIFGLAFGHLDSRSSIRHVLLVTSFISFVYSICQGSLEVLMHDDNFHVSSRGGIFLFGHGGVLFWFVSSLIFTLLYLVIIVLPLTRLKDKLALPEKKSFYVYIFVLMLLNISCSVGGGLLLFDIKEGLCIVDLTTCVYFTFFTPLVYHTFLSDFFDVSQPSILFSYKSQNDDAAEDDNVSLPRQQSFSSSKTENEFIYQTNSIYENIQFSSVGPVNPLYVASLQSPDSITGYSLDSQIIDITPSGKAM